MCLGVGGTEKTLCDAGGVGARCVGVAHGKIACGGDDAGRRASVAAGRARAAGIGIAAKTSDAQMSFYFFLKKLALFYEKKTLLVQWKDVY